MTSPPRRAPRRHAPPVAPVRDAGSATAGAHDLVTNRYSARWFATFLDGLPPARTEAEVAFLRRQLPLDRYPRVLDLACGPGRHARPLAEAGYDVTGVDVDRRAVEEARRLAGPGARFVEADMRNLAGLGDDFDAAVCMWQSFGHFDAAGNRAALREVRHRLRPGGRLVLDVYDRRFFAPRQGTRTTERDGAGIEERKALRDGRLRVELRYGDSGATDRFEWQVYTPDELAEVAATAGLRAVLRCRDFDESRAADGASPRMQLVFERPDG